MFSATGVSEKPGGGSAALAASAWNKKIPKKPSRANNEHLKKVATRVQTIRQPAVDKGNLDLTTVTQRGKR